MSTYSSAANGGPKASSICIESLQKKTAYCNKRRLDFVPNNLRPEIQELQIAGNSIQNLSDISFIRYYLLSDLDVSYNLISVIEIDTFKTLRLLTHLNLSNNPNIRTINSKLFKRSRRLLSLNLDNTGLTYFPDNIMKWFPNLENLYLNMNNLTFIHFKSCPKPQAHTSVYLSQNNISALTTETISINCDFKGVYLHKNPVVHVDSLSLSNLRLGLLYLGGKTMTLASWMQAFKGISLSDIRSLIIYSIGICNIPRNFFESFRNHSPSFLKILGIAESVNSVHPLAFRNLSDLNGLFIYDTNITTIKSDYFSGMRQLKNLTMSNRITSIQRSKTSWYNINMYELNLSHNKLRDIKPYTFHGLSALQILDLSSNEQLSVVEITSFSGLMSLQKLDLSFTNVQKLSIDVPLLEYFSLAGSRLGGLSLIWEKTFKFTRFLKKMFLIDANVHTWILYDAENMKSLFRGLHNLTYLSLRGNPLISLVSDMFTELFSLEYIDIGNSEIRSVAPGTFRGLQSLQTLWMDNNLIQEVSFDLLRDLPQLTTFHIEHNDINYLEKGLFRNKSILSGVYLANNHLVGFNQSTFEDISSSLIEIDISGNPLSCDCGLKWLAKWYTGPVKLKHGKKTICSPGSTTLSPLRGKPLTMLASTDLCGPQVTTYVFVTLPCLTVLVMLFLTYWHRWYLRNKLFLLKLAIIGYKELEDGRNRDDFEYMLNVMFTNDCEEWIQEHLQPFLEGTFPDMGRVVFGDDDLKLGMHYLDAVLYAVEHSYKTLFLLSRPAVQDHWFMLKFRLAMDYATDMGTENIILVFVEDVFDDDDLPYLVRLFLSGSGSYLNWVEEEEGQEYFWKQLEKYLNVNRRINHRLPAQ